MPSSFASARDGTLGYWPELSDVVASIPSKNTAPSLNSPPTGWPGCFSNNAGLKAFLGKKSLAGRRCRLAGPPADEDRSRCAGLDLTPEDSFGNAERVYAATGWEVIKGFAIYELGDAIGDAYVAHKRWWNQNDSGVWVDVTPRAEGIGELVLLESALSTKLKMPMTASARSIAEERIRLGGFVAAASAREPAPAVADAKTADAPRGPAPSSSSPEMATETPTVPPSAAPSQPEAVAPASAKPSAATGIATDSPKELAPPTPPPAAAAAAAAASSVANTKPKPTPAQSSPLPPTEAKPAPAKPPSSSSSKSADAAGTKPNPPPPNPQPAAAAAAKPSVVESKAASATGEEPDESEVQAAMRALEELLKLPGAVLAPARMRGPGTLADVLSGFLDPRDVRDRDCARTLQSLAHVVRTHERAPLFEAMRRLLAPRGTLRDLRSRITTASWSMCRELYSAKLFVDLAIPPATLAKLRKLNKAPSRSDWADAFGLSLPRRGKGAGRAPIKWRDYQDPGGDAARIERRVAERGGSLDGLSLREILTVSFPLPTLGEGWGSALGWWCASIQHHAEAVTSEMVDALARYLARRCKDLGGYVQLVEVGAGNGRLSYLLNQTGHLPHKIYACDTNPVGDDGTSGSLQFKVVQADDMSTLTAVAGELKKCIVLCAWMTLGQDRTPDWRGMGCVEEYVLVGELGMRPNIQPGALAGLDASSPLVPNADYDKIIGTGCYSLCLPPDDDDFERVFLEDVSAEMLHVRDAQDAAEAVPLEQREAIGAAVSFRRRGSIWAQSNYEKRQAKEAAAAAAAEPGPRLAPEETTQAAIAATAALKAKTDDAMAKYRAMAMQQTVKAADKAAAGAAKSK